MSRKKRKFFIDEKDAIELLKAYALQVEVMNFYQFRIRNEEARDYFWDWYHTQGTVVLNHKGSNSRWGSLMGDPEDLAIAINKFISEKVEL